jgi:hypothetical protein
MPAEDAASQGGAQKLAADLNDRWRDAVEAVRKRADTTAKALLALGTTALTALGIAKFSDIYPRPPGDGAKWVIAVLIVSFLAMAFVIVFFTVRVYRLSETLVMASDPDEITDLRGDDERDQVDKVYNQVAAEKNVRSLAAYEARAERLDRIAARISDADEVARLRDEATLIRTEVVTAAGRAALAVLRYRAGRVIKSFWAWVMYLVFFAAVIGFGFSSDWLDSARAGETKVATECAAAQKGGATTTPPICDQYLTTTPPPPPDPQAELDKAREEIAAALGRCRVAARKAGTNVADCAPLQRALEQSLGGG